ncbi:hypothetical protein E4U54_006823 [Claviceps lovelessii]|nr:hypothetical protein E4U54_006823 [Claviceps lovelessii]
MFRSRLLPRAGKSLGLSLRTTTFSARRSLHGIPTLPHDYSAGVPGLMSSDGFAIAWSDYMTLMLEKLNALTAGTELEGKDTKTISLMTAREPSQAPTFNYASMAHNNHFFFKGIAPGGTPMSDALRAELEASFSSIETLRREFIMTASAMFGPGFVWLVKAGPGDYRVLPTYLAGSPYPGAHWRAQPIDMNTVGNDGSAMSYYKNQVLGHKKRSGDLPPGGIELEPLLCLNTWEHAWLLDWGVGAGGRGGKVNYVEAWWTVIDWESVARKSDIIRPEFKAAN